MYIWWICFRLTKIEHLDAVPHLQMLYLQKNKINKIENLSHLKQLKKLYLSCNKISVIENLEDLTKLEGKYHLDSQVCIRFGVGGSLFIYKMVNKCLVRDIKSPNHEFCLTQFFQQNFFSLSSWRRKQFFYRSRIGLDQWKVCFLFHLVRLRKTGENKIRGLVVWCQEQDKNNHIFSNFRFSSSTE